MKEIRGLAKRNRKGSIKANNRVISLRIPGFMLDQLREISRTSNDEDGIAGVVRTLLNYYLFLHSPVRVIQEVVEADLQGKTPGGFVERYRNLLNELGLSHKEYVKFYERYLWERKRFDEIEIECRAKLEYLKGVVERKNG